MSIPRRCYLEKNTPEELAIRACIEQVEKLGADQLLTEVVVLLGEARNKLADWIDR